MGRGPGREDETCDSLRIYQKIALPTTQQFSPRTSGHSKVEDKGRSNQPLASPGRQKSWSSGYTWPLLERAQTQTFPRRKTKISVLQALSTL